MNFNIRKTYFFYHSKVTMPVIIKAFTQKSAWRKMRRFIISKMYGDWSLIYDSHAVDKEMDKVTIIEQEGNDGNSRS